MSDRSWPARRWLADRLIGDHAYSKNVVPDYRDYFAWNYSASWNRGANEGYANLRNPQETA